MISRDNNKSQNGRDNRNCVMLLFYMPKLVCFRKFLFMINFHIYSRCLAKFCSSQSSVCMCACIFVHFKVYPMGLALQNGNYAHIGMAILTFSLDAQSFCVRTYRRTHGNRIINDNRRRKLSNVMIIKSLSYLIYYNHADEVLFCLHTIAK